MMIGTGSVILPGNWGRIVRGYRSGFGDPSIAFRERALEDIRLTEFPLKPSRLDCVFTIENLDDMLGYWRQFNSTNIVYEVETINENSNIHRAPWVFDFNDQRMFYFDGAADMARIYWRGSNEGSLETLIGGPVRVLRRVTA